MSYHERSPQLSGSSHLSSSPSPRAARLAVAAIFLINGIAGANWFVRIPAVQERLDLSTATLGVALLGMPAGAILTMPLAGGLVARVGSRAVCWASSVAFCLALPLVGLAPNLPLLMVALVAFGASNGAMDVAMNAQGVLVERHYARSIMSSFHAAFSIGGLGGAALGGVIASRDVDARLHLVSVGLALAVLALVVPRWMLPAHADAHASVGEGHPLFVRVPRAVLALGVIGFCGLLAEGAMADWSAVYLDEVLAATPGVAAAGYAVFSLSMAAGRASGDRLTDRFGSLAIVRGGSLLAAAGLALVVVAPNPAPALAGFLLVGAGLSIIVPIIFSTAGRTPGIPSGQAIAAVTTTGYVGFLAGPPLIGILASLLTLRGSLALVIGLVLLMFALAGTVRRAEALHPDPPQGGEQPYATLPRRPHPLEDVLD